MSTCTVPSWYLREGDPYVQNFLRLMIERGFNTKKKFFDPKNAAYIQERPLFKSVHYWRQYGSYDSKPK